VPSPSVSAAALDAPPRVVGVAPGSPAERAGLVSGDEVLAVDGVRPRDVLEWRQLVDGADVELEVRRGGLRFDLVVAKAAGEPLGAEVHSAVFDAVRTCDNHCEFCFIHQLPPGLRQTLYLKDDDYRLSFLYGNFTTLTRFTESDLERVLLEGLSPLNVSIHATDPEVRVRMLRNRRGATSLRWLRALLDHGVAVHGQVVVCPGVNDGAVLDDTLAGVLDEYPELASVAVVPLGVSRWNREAAMRPHTRAEAEAVVDVVEHWQAVFLATLGRRLVHAADEYYLMAGRTFPPAETYDGFPMHEDGIGMARTFELEFSGAVADATGPQSGFFAWVEGAPAAGYRAPRNPAGDTGLRTAGGRTAGGIALRPGRRAPVGILTGVYGAAVLAPLVASLGRDDVRILPVRNDYFGGTVSVTGLLTHADVSRVLAAEPVGHRYLLPDVCLSQGRFIDGPTVDELPRPVEVVATDGIALRRALEVGRASSPTPAPVNEET
jgi:putative radical SAM enzyme (TIGR03279 family)